MIDTKDKIAEAAKKLFAERGYDKVTVRDIAAEADVALSALTYHFKTKENVLIHLADQFNEEHGRVSFASLSDVKSIDEFCLRLEIFAESFISFLLKDLPLFQLVHTEFGRKNPVLISMVVDHSRDHLPKLVKFIANAQKAGFVAKDIDAEMATLLLFKEIAATVRMQDLKSWANKGSLSNPEYRKKWIQSLLPIIFRGILPAEDKGSAKSQRTKGSKK